MSGCTFASSPSGFSAKPGPALMPAFANAMSSRPWRDAAPSIAARSAAASPTSTSAVSIAAPSARRRAAAAARPGSSMSVITTRAPWAASTSA
jgi:hypothetical protein